LFYNRRAFPLVLASHTIDLAFHSNGRNTQSDILILLVTLGNDSRI
jgi:hypothetical protein